MPEYIEHVIHNFRITRIAGIKFSAGLRRYGHRPSEGEEVSSVKHHLAAETVT